MSKHVIQIVRRFSKCGGMEIYVWNLCHELVSRGVGVTVVCIDSDPNYDAQIKVERLSVAQSRRRFIAMLEFSDAVESWWLENKLRFDKPFVHSHERASIHSITTFHGPPMAPIRKTKPLISFFSRRIRTWLSLERREVLGVNVEKVLPVSSAVGRDLLRYYPEVENRILLGGYPGVDDPVVRIQRVSADDRFRIVFVGKEHKRKGLGFAVKVAKQMIALGVNASLDVYGPDLDAIPSEIKSCDYIRILGFEQNIPWSDYDCLLHPATQEPFGMVISEAIQAGLFVAASSKTGASDLFDNYEQAEFLDLDLDPKLWAERILDLVKKNKMTLKNLWTWADLAEFHDRNVYV
jgi:UDP-glucose:(heptosyl)LPS alpha-1,3-glucosyltransferase